MMNEQQTRELLSTLKRIADALETLTTAYVHSRNVVVSEMPDTLEELIDHDWIGRERARP
jgi:hypothetical protein